MLTAQLTIANSNTMKITAEDLICWLKRALKCHWPLVCGERASHEESTKQVLYQDISYKAHAQAMGLKDENVVKMMGEDAPRILGKYNREKAAWITQEDENFALQLLAAFHESHPE
jgi:hypothetical protein